MTKFQNWKMQACAEVIIEQNDKLLELSKDTANLPSVILKHLKDTLSLSHDLLDRVGRYKPDSDIRSEDIAKLCYAIGNLSVDVAMVSIQIKSYRQREE